jgi:hypothetical protein
VDGLTVVCENLIFLRHLVDLTRNIYVQHWNSHDLGQIEQVYSVENSEHQNEHVHEVVSELGNTIDDVPEVSELVGSESQLKLFGSECLLKFNLIFENFLLLFDVVSIELLLDTLLLGLEVTLQKLP